MSKAEYDTLIIEYGNYACGRGEGDGLALIMLGIILVSVLWGSYLDLKHNGWQWW